MYYSLVFVLHLQGCVMHDIVCGMIKERLESLASALEYSGVK